MSKRNANKERNEKKIREAAIQLFIEKGISETTIDEIATKSGLAKGTFYNYYKSKAAIWNTIIAELLTALNKGAKEEREKANALHEFIYNAYYAAFTELTKAPYPALIAKNQVQFREALYQGEELFTVIGDLEKDLRKSELFKGLPSSFYKMYTYAMVGAGFELVIQSYLNQDNFSIEEMTAFITLIFEKSLITKKK